MEESHCFSHSFQTDVLENFRSLREQSEGYDVMLGCSNPDSSQMVCMQAHKMIIAASSPLLSNVMLTYEKLEHPASPFLYLGEISQKDLKYILDYIYYGDVTVPQEDVASFTSAAEQLQIRGIAKELPNNDLDSVINQARLNYGNSDGTGFSNNLIPNGMIPNGMTVSYPKNSTPLSALNPKAAKRPKLEKTPKVKKESNNQASITPAKASKPGAEKTPVDDKYKGLATEEYKIWKEKFSTSDGTKFDCHACSEVKSFTAGSSLLRHYKQSHEEVCKTCKMPFHDAQLMEIHYREKHEFPCNICGKTFTAPSSVLRHMKKDHPMNM